jgi:hypothetical protein
LKTYKSKLKMMSPENYATAKLISRLRGHLMWLAKLLLLVFEALPVYAIAPFSPPAVAGIGTAYMISCTGYLITAAHVLLDPVERGYGDVTRKGNLL